jgi:hypothetical protein
LTRGAAAWQIVLKGVKNKKTGKILNVVGRQRFDFPN